MAWTEAVYFAAAATIMLLAALCELLGFRGDNREGAA